MFKKLRLLAIVMAFSLIAGQLCIVNVNAAEGVGSRSGITELSGISLTGIDRPVVGKYLDNKAMVRTRENISWEIPVIWTDDLGNTATIAEEGRSYTPNFIFFVPEGYTIKEMSPDGRFTVKLPDFLIQTFGEDSLIFAIDAGRRITYITFVESLGKKGTLPEYEEYKAPAIGPVEESTDTSDAGDEDKPSGGNNDSLPATIPEQVRIHCSQGAISTLGTEILEDLVSRIKNKLEPQAVNLLKNSFEAYNYARNDALGTQIGLYIYYEQGSIDGHKTPEGALAYVSSGYIDDIYKYVIGVDSKTIMEKDPETGEWKYNEGEKTNFCNTIVHEMMHAFMDDYTRYGMESNKDGFPAWFVEGSASAVENVYQYRAYMFQTLGNVNEKSGYDYGQKRYKDPVRYSTSSIYNKYCDAGLKDDYRYDLKFSGDDDNIGSAYVSGYLAYVYLGYMAAMYEGYQNQEGHSDIITYNDINNTPTDISDDTVSIDISGIRFGANKILERLHQGYSLDSIIKDYSAQAGEEKSSLYSSTDDFQEKFIKGSGEGNVNRPVYNSVSNTSTDIMGSLAFCTYYLNYLESKSSPGAWNNLANGSILRDNMDYRSPIDWDTEEESSLYNIVNSGSYVASTANENYAWKQTGGKTVSGDDLLGESGDQSGEVDESGSKIIDIDGSGQDETLPAAAKSEVSVASSESAHESIDEETSENTSETVSEASDVISDDVITDEPTIAISDEPIDNIPVVEEEKSDTDDIIAKGIESAPVNDVPSDIIVDNIITDESGNGLSLTPVQEDAIIPDNEIYIEESTGGNNDSDGGNDPSGDAGNDSGSESGSDNSGSDDSGSDDGGNSDTASDSGDSSDVSE